MDIGWIRRQLVALAWVGAAWLMFLVLVNPYLLLRSKGDELRGWYHLGRMEDALFAGHAPTHVLQQQLYQRDIVWLDFAAFAAHFSWFFLPFIAGILLSIFERERLFEFLGWVLATFYISTIAFLLLPVRPPWMDGGAVRILMERSFIEYTSLDNNQVAAFPSLHAGLPAAMFLFFALRSTRLRLLRWPYLAACLVISFSVVYLGEHWVLDVAAGYAVAGLVALLFVHPAAHRLYRAVPHDPLARFAHLNARLSAPNSPSPLPAASVEPHELPRAA